MSRNCYYLFLSIFAFSQTKRKKGNQIIHNYSLYVPCDNWFHQLWSTNSTGCKIHWSKFPNYIIVGPLFTCNYSLSLWKKKGSREDEGWRGSSCWTPLCGPGFSWLLTWSGFPVERWLVSRSLKIYSFVYWMRLWFPWRESYCL